jgi:hypothetical protein
MEHTNEFLQGMFAAYMGCEVMLDNGQVKKIEGVGRGRVDLPSGISSMNLTRKFTDVKPILTPLSEITYEDAVEVAKIMKIPQHERAKLFGCDENNYYTIGRHIRKEIIETCSDDGFYLQGAVIDYLRSKKYDCGYLNINFLIEAGLAVKATK